MYHKNDLPVKNRIFLQIPNTLVAKISISKKKIFFITSYRKPSQSNPEFSTYCEQLDSIFNKIALENPFMTIITGDFNAKHSKWYSEDKTDHFGIELYNLFAKHALVQTVNEPTNIVTRNITTDNITTATTSKHCIDLVATDQPNIIIKNEVAPSLHSNCSHQINLVKLDLKSSLPSPYKRKVFHYARANGPSFRESLFNFDWADQLELLSNSPSDQVELLDSTILNVANNFIPNN